jgi:hypothetical protein
MIGVAARASVAIASGHPGVDLFGQGEHGKSWNRVSIVSSLYWEVQAEERPGYQAPDKESLRFIRFKLISGSATALKKELAASSHVVGW